MDNEPYEKQNEGWQDSKPKPGWMQLMAEQEEVIEIVSDDEDSKPAPAKPELVEISDDGDDAWGLSDDDEWEKEMAAAGSGTAIAAKNLAAGGLGGASGPAPDAEPDAKPDVKPALGKKKKKAGAAAAGARAAAAPADELPAAAAGLVPGRAVRAGLPAPGAPAAGLRLPAAADVAELTYGGRTRAAAFRARAAVPETAGAVRRARTGRVSGILRAVRRARGARTGRVSGILRALALNYSVRRRSSFWGFPGLMMSPLSSHVSRRFERKSLST